MRRFYEGNDNKGYQEVVDKESGLELIGFDLIRLEPGENAVYESEEYEIGLVILQGTCSVKVDDVTFDKLGSRRSVFDGKPTTVYVPRDSKYEVTATGSMMLEIGVCKVKARKKYEAFVIDAGDVTTEHRGKLNWQRDVNDIITSKYEGKVDRIVLGETYSMPGQWSSYPSHKHDTDNLPFEVNMEEIYHFKVNPGQGFGIQVMYSDDMSLRESYIIKNGDSVAIKNGYHPVVAAPGYQVYYLWVMAGVDTRQLTPCDDPDHAWVKAVEKMV
mgnify:FL=1